MALTKADNEYRIGEIRGDWFSRKVRNQTAVSRLKKSVDWVTWGHPLTVSFVRGFLDGAVLRIIGGDTWVGFVDDLLLRIAFWRRTDEGIATSVRIRGPHGDVVALVPEIEFELLARGVCSQHCLERDAAPLVDWLIDHNAGDADFQRVIAERAT